LISVLSFGEMPLSGRVLSAAEAREPQPRAPLDFAFCPGCALAQIAPAVDPRTLHLVESDGHTNGNGNGSTLAYGSVDRSGTARQLIRSRRLGPTSMVVEAGGTDGSILRPFVQAGIPAIGIGEPDGTPPRSGNGIPTLKGLLDEELAQMLRDAFGIRAEVVLAGEALTHAPDLNAFVGGVRALLQPDGVAIIEVPYLIDLVDKCQFDAIDHQHPCYFSMTALEALFARNGLHVNDVEHTSANGGSLRLTVEQQDDRRERVAQLLAAERDRAIRHVSFYDNFVARVAHIKERLEALLREHRAAGRHIAAYGSSWRAAMLCSYAGIGPELVDYVVDSEDEGGEERYLAGTLLPIAPPQRLQEDPPDVLLILAWNIADEVMRRERVFRERGGRFIIPIPGVEVVS
jgi:hypothetical protein